jgi:hypothetical protein
MTIKERQSKFGQSSALPPLRLAGVTIQAALRGFGGILGSSTLSCAIWLIDHEQVLGSRGRLRRRCSGNGSERSSPSRLGLRAPPGSLSSTPTMNSCRRYTRAPWRRTGTAGIPPRIPWLRFVAARLWLDQSFVEALDSRQFEAIAELSRHGRVTTLSLRPELSLAELEAALAPILPRFQAGQLARG